jgi:3-phenylpropionate/cinnamic acid dioxygenase small subunit
MSTAELELAPALSVEDRFAIHDLYHASAAALDDGRYADWPSFFTDDAVYQLIPKENYDRKLPIAIIYCDGKAMIEDRAFTTKETTIAQPRSLRHFISGISVLGGGADGYRVNAQFLVVQTMQDRLTEIVMSGRYVDTVVRKDGRFRFAHRVCVSDTLLYPTSVVAPV